MAEQEIREELDALKEDLTHLRGDLGDLLKALKSSGKSQAANVGAKLQEETMYRMGQIRGAVDTAKDYGYKAYRQAHKKLGARPVTGILAAFAVGMVLGRLFGGRK